MSGGMSAATVDQLNELRTMMQQEVQGLRNEAAAETARVEARTQAASGDVLERSDAKFTAVQAAFTAEQTRLGVIFKEAEDNWKAEQVRMNKSLETLKSQMEALASTNIDEVVRKIAEQDEREVGRVSFLHELIRSEGQANTRSMGMLTTELEVVRGRMN